MKRMFPAAWVAAIVLALAFAWPRKDDRSPIATKVMSKAGSMAFIPAGTVILETETGSRQVKGFSIDVTEVTVDAYDACVRAGVCTKPIDDGRCNWAKRGRGNHPVNCVDWTQAREFCAWAGKRLPSEDEWQLAAESAEGRDFPWGSRTPSNQLCWDGEGSPVGKWNRQGTCEVGSFPEGDSAQGVKDLSGNVWEWTESCGKDCDVRVDRGGSWFNQEPGWVRAARRDSQVPSMRVDSIGFRCARSD